MFDPVLMGRQWSFLSKGLSWSHLCFQKISVTFVWRLDWSRESRDDRSSSGELFSVYANGWKFFSKRYKSILDTSEFSLLSCYSLRVGSMVKGKSPTHESVEEEGPGCDFLCCFFFM